MAALKRATPFLQRAEELAAHSPVVSYYCRLHALDLLGKARAGGDQTEELKNKLLSEVLAAETQKKSIDTSNGTEETTAFALAVFDAADAKDREQLTDEASKRQFYVAAQLIDVCAQFYEGQLPSDLAEKSRYAKFRAVQIADALRRGESPCLPKPEPEAAVDSEEAAVAALLASGAGSASAPQGAGAAGSPPAASNEDPEEAAVAALLASAASAGAGAGASAPHPASRAAQDSADEAAAMALLMQGSAFAGAPPQEVAPPAPMTGRAFAAFAAPAATAPPAAAVPSPTPTQSSAPVRDLSAQERKAAIKKVDFASSSLDFSDTASARRFLLEALAILDGR